MKKIPGGSEAANILIGQVDFLQEPIMALVRMGNSSVLGDLTEISLPTRFIFLALGPPETTTVWECVEVGRAMAALLTDMVLVYNACYIILQGIISCILYYNNIGTAHAQGFVTYYDEVTKYVHYISSYIIVCINCLICDLIRS